MRDRALEALSRFGQRLREVPRERVRAVATHTVRQLSAPQSFLVPAETALGHSALALARTMLIGVGLGFSSGSIYDGY